MMKPKETEISVVVPVYNEKDAVVKLHSEILKVLHGLNLSYEIIFIDDGSTDGTFDELRKLSPIKIIQFRKNFGQTAALDAGFKYADGDVIVAMDGDGQNDPSDIPKMLKVLEDENVDVVSGWRKKRKDPFSKKIASRLAATLRKFLIDDGIHDSGCTLKVYRRECLEHLDLFGEMHRFIPALLKIKGFKIGEVEVNHRPRETGKTKYNWKRGVKGILDMFSVWFWKKYAGRPLHLFGTLGLVLISISFFSGIWVTYQKIFLGFDLSDTFLTELTMFGFLIGIQFIIFGLIADLISKIYFSSTEDKFYKIKEVIYK